MRDLSDVGVVVVTYASATTVLDTLRALPLDRLGGVVVVDNDSPDATVEVVTGARLPGVRLVRQPNAGFGAGCNRGVAELPDVASVLFLNPDAVLSTADLETLVTYLDDRPRCAVVGPRVRSGGEPSYSAGRLATLATELRPLLPHPLSAVGPHRRLPPDYDRSGPVGYVEGACFLVRRDALVAVGGFDERYFLYFEEMDLGRRLARAGWEVHLCADAVVDHAIGVSRAELPFAGRPHLVRSCVRYLADWEGRRAARAWVTAARASWALRERLGRLPAEERRAGEAAALEALRADVKHS